MENRERPPEAIVRHVALEKSLTVSMHHLVCGVAIPNSDSKKDKCRHAWLQLLLLQRGPGIAIVGGTSARITSMPIDELGMQMNVQKIHRPYEVHLNWACLFS